MMIEIKKMGADAVIEICGRLDTTTAPVLDKTISENISENTNLTLDLKGLEIYLQRRTSCPAQRTKADAA